jgi:Nucleotidyl transferase AbiEii toxin, Type IV TA system
MSQARRKAPHSTSVIERWINEYAREEGMVVNRLQRWVWFMVVLAVLDRVRGEDGEPLFILKGGAAMELRLRLQARTTQDIDTIFRRSIETMLERLDEALQAGWGEFTFERTPPESIKHTRSVRLKIKLAYRGRRWGTVPFEVAPIEGEAGNDIETVNAIAIDQFGLDGLIRVPCLGVRYQIAQKIHACTEPPIDGKNENPRFHDLLDLIFLRDLVAGDAWPGVRRACVDTFEVRGKHSWPPELIVHASWPQAFVALAVEHGVGITDVDEAARQVREMIARIDTARDAA